MIDVASIVSYTGLPEISPSDSSKGISKVPFILTEDTCKFNFLDHFNFLRLSFSLFAIFTSIRT